MLSSLHRFALLPLALIAGAVTISAAAGDTFGPGDGYGIPDDNTAGVNSSILINEVGEITDLDLILSDLSHSFLGDLIINLTHEDSGTSWNITNRAGQLEGGDETFGFDIDLDGTYTIDDESTNGSFHDQISFEGGLLPPGDYNSLGSLANFDGLDVAGSWTLSISDNAGGDTGELGSWSLRVETTGGPGEGLVFAFEETASGVTGSLSGSLDLSNAVTGNTVAISALGARINPPFPFISTGSSSGVSVDSYLLSTSLPFGPGEASSETLIFASSASGEFFSLTRSLKAFGGELVEIPLVFVPDGYVSGTGLAATMFFDGATFESLGITPGTYIYPLLQGPPDNPPSAGSSGCFTPEQSSSTLTLTFGEAGGATRGDCVFSSRFEPAPDIVRFEHIDFVPNEDATGGSIRWIDGATCDCDTSDFNFNVFGSANSLQYFWPRGLGGVEGGVSLDNATYAVLSSGETIGPESTFIGATGSPATSAWSTPGDVTGYLGFRFEDKGQVKYGYALISTGAGGRPATIIGYAFDNSGAAITIP